MQSSATDPPPLNGSILKDGSGHEARGAMARKRHKPKLRRVEVLRGQGRTMAPDRRFRADLLQLGGMSRDRLRQWKDLQKKDQLRKAVADPTLDKPFLTATAREDFSASRLIGPASTTFDPTACNGAQAVPRAGAAQPHAASHPPRPGRRRHRCADAIPEILAFASRRLATGRILGRISITVEIPPSRIAPDPEEWGPVQAVVGDATVRAA